MILDDFFWAIPIRLHTLVTCELTSLFARDDQ